MVLRLKNGLNIVNEAKREVVMDSEWAESALAL